MTEAEAIKTFHESKNLFQSGVWQKFQEPLGRKSYRFSILGNDILVIRYSLYRNWTYLFVPKGPTVISNELLKDLTEEVSKIKEKTDVFLRMEPPTDDE
ncbi:hypothetical protein COZ22_03570, partial [bacterium (Candidatus Howlettbacteria) CG_4_10_14_3_um_filter_37_10]